MPQFVRGSPRSMTGRVQADVAADIDVIDHRRLPGRLKPASVEIAGKRRRPPRPPSPGTVEPVTTVLVTAMVLVAVMFVVLVATLALAARAHRRRQLDDARAEARHWVERLGGELIVLDGAAARLGTGTAAGLTEAAGGYIWQGGIEPEIVTGRDRLEDLIGSEIDELRAELSSRLS